MNRKILLTVLALTVILMASPYVGMVQAWGGHDDHKLYFKLYMEGMTKGPPAQTPWVTADGYTHVRGLPWVVTGDFMVWIGNAAPLSLPPAAYSGHLDLDISPTGFITLSVHETITFAGGALKIVTAETMQGGVGGGTFVGYGKGVLDDAKVKGTSSAVETATPSGTLDIITREGTVKDWPHLIHASMTSQSITYDQLTAMCLAAGLSKNPYPAPTVPTVVGPDENLMLYVYDIPYYFTFSLTIGCKTYEGISCDHADFVWNVTSSVATMVYHPTWYVGELGCLHNGFKGTANMQLWGYYNDGAGNEGWDYYVMAFDFHGFGHFRGQGLWQSGDSRVNPDASTGNIFSFDHRC